jgi:AcrR family transcriptional regulator
LQPNERSIDMQDKKIAIFESTLKLIREHGIHATPMSQIAKHANVATGTIYHYFESKDDLILQLFSFSRSKISQMLHTEAHASKPYRERFEKVWLDLVLYYIHHFEYLVFFEQFFSSPYVHQLGGHESMCFQDEVSLFLKQGIQDGHIKPLDIHIISAAYIGTITATAKRFLNPQFKFENQDLRTMVQIVWDGIKK